eukprot:scaffold135259_cov40-Attheya_sp.AAC.1
MSGCDNRYDRDNPPRLLYIPNSSTHPPRPATICCCRSVLWQVWSIDNIDKSDGRQLAIDADSSASLAVYSLKLPA